MLLYCDCIQYPISDLFVCLSAFAEEAVSDWLDDAYDEGLWDIDYSPNGSSVTMENLLDEGIISSPGELNPAYWEGFGGHWKGDQEGAAAFYDKLLDDDAYNKRLSMCGYTDVSVTTFEEEFGDFEEYCTDPCGCEIADNVEESEDETSGEGGGETTDSVMLIGIVICAVVVILGVIILMVVVIRRYKLKNEVNTSIKREHVAHTSTVSGIEEGTAGQRTTA